MIDKNQPILSANKNLSYATIRRFCWPIKLSNSIVQHRTLSILNDKIGQLFISRNEFCLRHGLRYHMIVYNER